MLASSGIQWAYIPCDAARDAYVLCLRGRLRRLFHVAPDSFLGLDVRERLVFTLFQLCSTFGVIESRGTLLPVSLSHKDLADLVGASRPRVGEHLAELEREHLLIRQVGN